MRKKKDDKRVLIKKVLVLISCCILFLSCYKIYDVFHIYKEGEQIYNDIRDAVKKRNPTWTGVTQEADDNKYSRAEIEMKNGTIELEEIDMSDYEREGSIEGKPGLRLFDLIAIRYNIVDFEKLREINSDVVGWITIEGTNIDYPVVQGEDNTYYLRKTITNEFNIAGSIFVDCKVKNPFYCENTIIHGHNQRNHAMFHFLSYYTDRDYFDNHKYILIYLPTGRCVTYEIYSFYISDSISVTYNCNYEGNEYSQYLDYTLKSSWYETGINLTTDDKIITLSTCTNNFEDKRYVIHGRKIS